MPFLPSPLPVHDLITIIHHAIVDSAAVIFNILLLFAVILRSPSILRSYKVLLLSSAIIDLLGSSTMLLIMVRLIPARHVLAYVYYGPCALVSGFFCHCLSTIMLSTFSQSLFQIAVSFIYRLYILGRPSPSNKAVFVVCLIVSIPNLLILTTYMFALDDSTDVREQLRVLRPSYALDGYVVEGHASIFNATVMFAIIAMTIPIGPTMILIVILRKRVLAKLTAHSMQMSGRTAQMHSTLTKPKPKTASKSVILFPVLTLQSVLPVFFSVAVSSYALCQLDVVCSPLQEHFIMEAVSFMPLLAPMVTLYCMKPYKEFVISVFRCKIAELKGRNNEASTTRAI